MPNDIQSIEDLLKYTGAHPAPQSASVAGQQTTVEKFEEKMQEVRLKEKEMEAATLAKQLGMPYVNLKGFPVSPEALRLIPQERAETLKTVCFLFTGPEIRLASLNPE